MLNSTGESLKEQILGIEVFERRADWDAQHDSIVRTTAGRLRMNEALELKYYGSEGNDAFRIELPVGSVYPLQARR